MAYDERLLTPEWQIVENGQAHLVFKEPTSTRGIYVRATISAISGMAEIRLQIESVTCSEEYACSSA
jgi:hypothetical protein